MLSSTKQATIGKTLMNIKVVLLNGNSLSFFEALIRTLIKYLHAKPITVNYLQDSKDKLGYVFLANLFI